jgi:hypothetical protein
MYKDANIVELSILGPYYINQFCIGNDIYVIIVYTISNLKFK